MSTLKKRLLKNVGGAVLEGAWVGGLNFDDPVRHSCFTDDFYPTLNPTRKLLLPTTIHIDIYDCGRKSF